MLEQLRRASTKTLLVASLLPFASCAEGYSVTVLFSPESLADDAVTVEVSLVESCADQAAADGAPPAGALVEVEAIRGFGADELGEVEPGVYGLYGRARADTCDVIAAGCTEFELEGGGSDDLELYLRPVEGPGCDGAASCDRGRCLD